MDENHSNPSDLQQLTPRTLGHYAKRVPKHFAGTRDHDVRQNYPAANGRNTNEKA